MGKWKTNDQRGKINRGCIEANTLAIIDSSAEYHKDSQDDHIDFLEAVRTSSIVPENGTPPTKKMVEAIFKILKAGKSLELIMSSYELLNEIEKCFPRVYISESFNKGPRELVVIKEAWQPFTVSVDVASSVKETNQKNPGGLFDPTGFHELITALFEMTHKRNSQRLDTEFLGNMLLFQYLVNVLEGDFILRNNMYKESMNWNFLKESLLNMLLASRRVAYKILMKDCLYTICGLSQDYAGINESDGSETSPEKSSENHNIDVSIALLEVQRTTCMAMQKLLIMIMELDMSKQQADMLNLLARSDGLRTPLVDIILDELNYHRNILPIFLQVFNDPKWKLEIIVQYLHKYTAKLTVRTRRSSAPSEEDFTFLGVLKSFSDHSSTRNMIKKCIVDFQLLLAHGFLAYMSSTSQHLPSMPDRKEAVIDSSSVVEIAKNVAAAFNSLRESDKNFQISSLGKEALFTATMIISTS